MIKNVGYNSSVKWVASKFYSVPVVPVSFCQMVADLWMRDLETVKADVTEVIIQNRKGQLAVRLAISEGIPHRRAVVRAETEVRRDVSFDEIIDAASVLDGSLPYTMKATREMVDLVVDLLGERGDTLRQIPDWPNSPQHLQWLEEADNFLLFLMNNCSPALGVHAARRTISQMKLPFLVTKMKHFDDFAFQMRDAIFEGDDLENV